MYPISIKFCLTLSSSFLHSSQTSSNSFSIILILIGYFPYIINIYEIQYLLLFIVFIKIPLIWLFYIRMDINSIITDFIFASKLLKVITIGGMIVIFSIGF